ncbi:metal-sulfur cluster assembly factor [Flaviaesturariibacter flavus]|uniref:Metal-sulfur cluster assembly factor n=1 Tax=Flaviaesturariibacter flavus TaxID=2502780 RepID=A0A4R1B261_9BACT|nr:metal-sulfur cluster assembly factor [Flaviaesturariibacter flavus]TCJ12132.1 metal-sulfur cluster assembly factor [Flaviaesturariibacter flavus]
MSIPEVINQLKTIYDPEIPVNIYDLGLIYNIRVIGSEAYIVMTLTTAACPAAAFMPEAVRAAVTQVPGIEAVHVDVTFEPRWTNARMSAEARAQLGFS